MLNHAQKLLLSIVQGNGEFFRASYKAPHAPKGTPERPKIDRESRFAEGEFHVAKPRLFKGWRP